MRKMLRKKKQILYNIKNMKPKLYWLNQKLEVRKSKIGGKGTFSKENIKKGERLLILGGYISKISDEKKLPEEFNDNGAQITENLVLGALNQSELGGINYFNHSCEPNAGFKGQIFLVAMKDIEKGKEIVFDYAMTLFDSKGIEPYNMKCLCGTKECRGFVTGNDWKIPKLQKKYSDYFQYYLSEKIKK